MNETNAHPLYWTAIKWLEKIIHYVNTQLNPVDLIFFGLGAAVLFIVVFVIFRKKKRKHIEELSLLCDAYEEDIQEIKRRHLHEIAKAEERIATFKKKEEEIEADFAKDLEEKERAYSKRVQKMEKGHAEIRSTDEMSMYELKQEIGRLRKTQVSEVETFEGKIKGLKEEIENLHERHAKEMERSEMEISDLRKQMRALMYRV